MAGGTVLEDELIELELPVQPRFVSTARLFIGEASRHFGLEEETVADLKMAISEVCTGAIQSQTVKGDETPIRLSVEEIGEGIRFEVRSAGGFKPMKTDEWDPSTPTDLFQRALGVEIVHALFPEAQFIDQQNSGLLVRIVVPMS